MYDFDKFVLEEWSGIETKSIKKKQKKYFTFYINKESLFMCPKFKFKHFTMGKD